MGLRMILGHVSVDKVQGFMIMAGQTTGPYKVSGVHEVIQLGAFIIYRMLLEWCIGSLKEAQQRAPCLNRPF